MATVELKNIKKVYPYISGEQKKSKKKEDQPEKSMVNSTRKPRMRRPGRS